MIEFVTFEINIKLRTHSALDRYRYMYMCVNAVISE